MANGNFSPLLVSLREAEAAGLRVHVHVTRRWAWLDRSPRRTALAWARKFGANLSEGGTVLIYVNQRTRRFSVVCGSPWAKKVGPRYWIEYAEALRSDLLSTHWERALAIGVRTLTATYSASAGGGVY